MQRLDDARSIARLLGTIWYFPESIMTKKEKKKQKAEGKTHVESTESPVNWIEQISCFRILRLALLFFLHVEFHASHTSVFVCVNLIVLLELQFLVIGINVWSLARMCGDGGGDIQYSQLLLYDYCILHACRHTELAVFFFCFVPPFSQWISIFCFVHIWNAIAIREKKKTGETDGKNLKFSMNVYLLTIIHITFYIWNVFVICMIKP